MVPGSGTAVTAAVVVISDGRRNIGPQGAELARLLNQRKVPSTFVLGTGDPSETQTVEITRFDAPEKVFQRDPFEMQARTDQPERVAELKKLTAALERETGKLEASARRMRSK